MSQNISTNNHAEATDSTTSTEHATTEHTATDHASTNYATTDHIRTDHDATELTTTDHVSNNLTNRSPVKDTTQNTATRNTTESTSQAAANRNTTESTSHDPSVRNTTEDTFRDAVIQNTTEDTAQAADIRNTTEGTSQAAAVRSTTESPSQAAANMNTTESTPQATPVQASPDQMNNHSSDTSIVQPIVRYRNVTKAFGDHVVLKELNLDIMPGEKIALIGPSGSGKTTIARLLMTLERPTSGTIEVNGEMLWHMKHKGKLVAANEKHLHRMRGSIGMVFQHFNLFPHMTILQNVMEGLVQVRKMPKAQAEERALELLSLVGLQDHTKHYPAQLSGGQKQRVAIARALVMQPQILLFDEVTSALDPELVGEVLDVIKGIAAKKDTAMMLITHEMDFARDIADRVLFTDGGVIVEEGPPEQIFGNPQSPRLQSFLTRFLSDRQYQLAEEHVATGVES